MEQQHIKGFGAAGFSVRTTNAAEQNSEIAKIGLLWQRYFSEAGPKLNPESKTYGVYTNYESDHNGAFDVIACADTLLNEDADELVQTQIDSGSYLVFAASGEFPNVVIELWQEIWAYFSKPNCPHQRAYITDFEFYKSAQNIEIYIGVES